MHLTSAPPLPFGIAGLHSYTHLLATDVPLVSLGALRVTDGNDVTCRKARSGPCRWTRMGGQDRTHVFQKQGKSCLVATELLPEWDGQPLAGFG
jgi:hypothetical protein